MASLNDVLITPELSNRPARAPDFESESRALGALVDALADAPETVLQRIVETAAALAGVPTAGITLLEDADGGAAFRWHAATGPLAPSLTSPLPRDDSPCGVVLETGTAHLFREPAEHYPTLRDLAPGITEALLMPVRIHDETVGTLWLAAHDGRRRFDNEDVRMMSSLARFCPAAIGALHAVPGGIGERLHARRALEARPATRRAREAVERRVRQQVEQAWRDSERRFHVVVQNLPDYAIMMLDTEGNVVAWNDGARRIKGYSEAEVLGRHVSIFYPPEEMRIARPQQEMALARAEGRSEVEGYRVRKDGRQLWVNEIVTAIRDDAGRLTGFAKISRDLTERKALHDALQESEERHRLVAENARDFAIIMQGPDGRILSWNTGAERIFGYSAAEAIGRDCAMLFTPEDLAAGADRREQASAISEGRALDERWQVRKGGERFWASGVTTPVRDAAGALRGFAKICRDMTDQRRIEEQRERLLDQEKLARLEAERAMTMRDEFLAVVSHELRTPLTAILIWTKLLRDAGEAGDAEPLRDEAIRSIEQSAQSQRYLIDDLLDISRMLSGKLRLNVRDANLASVVEAATETVRPMAAARGVAIDLSLERPAAPVKVDPDRIQQVLWNLLSNAVKFTEAGGRVHVHLRPHAGGVQIQVRDTGHGIAADFLPHVFERFRQADASTTRVHGGLGLGLSIASQLVELHGGTIRAESAGAGQGSTFTVDLPGGEAAVDAAAAVAAGRDVSAPGGEAPALASPLRGVRVLLVEDDAHARAAFRLLLEEAAAEVIAVETAALAVAAFRESLESRRFDLLISDIGMPVQDGFELLHELREMERRHGTSTRTPAIALTAYAHQEARAKAERAGFAMHVPKPVEPAELIAKVAALVAPP